MDWPEPPDPDGLVAREPAEPTITRRGMLAFVGAGSALLLLVNVGRDDRRPAAPALAARPAQRRSGAGAQRLPGQQDAPREPASRPWAPTTASPLRSGGRELRLSRDDLLALEQRTATLPIACVEGWTTTQRWTGVPLARFAALAGAGDAGELHVESLQQSGTFRQVTLTRAQFTDDRALLALKVNGADLSADHGFPARIIVPALPGVHNTKWVAALTFRGAA